MRKVTSAVALCVGCSFMFASLAAGQGRGGGTWSTAGGDPQLSGWQKTEPRLTKANAKQMKYLWKLKLGSVPVTEPTEVLFAGHTITNAGFKDMTVVVGPGGTLSNVDYELGTILWQKELGAGATKSGACTTSGYSGVVVQPAAAFGGGGGRGAAAPGRGAAGAPAAPAAALQPPPNPPAPVARVGAGLANGGGFGGSRGVFVLTSDGKLHEQILTNGWDFGAPIDFVPAGTAIGSPAMSGSQIYANATGCGGSANGAFSVDVGSETFPRASYSTGSVGVTGTSGPAMSTDSKTLYVTTGSGSGSGDVHANSVVALDAKTLAVKDYFTPSGADSKININVSPVVFAYQGRDVIGAYVAGGRLALLDSASLGGSDHHTPLAITGPISKDGGAGSWGRLASAQDSNGTRFVYVSVRGALAAGAKLPTGNGVVTDGAVVAFKVTGDGGSLTLTPAWVSPNVANPSPAAIVMNTAPQPAGGGFGPAPAAAPAGPPPVVIAGGLVFTLGEGGTGSHAKLLALDAETGAQVFASGDELAASANMASISVSGAHVMFLAADNTLYAYGIEYERN